MPLKEIIDREHEGVVHLRWALGAGRELSRRVLASARLEHGQSLALVPAQQALTSFREGGGATVEECTTRIADLCMDFLSSSGRIVVFEHHLIDVTDDRSYLVPPVRIAGDGVYELAGSGASRETVTQMIGLWNVLPIFNAFLAELSAEQVDRMFERPEGAEIDLDPIVSGLRAIVCGAYDGEGALLWRAPDAAQP